MKKRLFAILLLAVLLLTMLPAAALAEEAGEGGEAPPAEPDPAPAEETPAEPDPPTEPETPEEPETPTEPEPAYTEPAGAQTEAAAAAAEDTAAAEPEQEPGNVWGIPADDVIWFGFYDEAPVAWLVLDDGQTNMGTEGVFLLSRGLIDRGKVKHDDSLTIWEGSMSQQWCTNFAGTAFSPAESALVPPTSKHDEFAHLFLLDWSEMDLKDEQVFFLSAQEMAQYFGSTSGDSYVTIKDSSLEKYYWLRSTPAIHYGYHGMVLSQNTVHDYEPNHHYSARPGINLSLQDVLWVLPAEDEGQLGAVTVPERMSGTALEWKLIVPLEEHSFQVESASLEGRRLMLAYSGADTGEKAMLSLLARDQDGAPLGLWRLERPTASQGELEVDLQALNVPEDASLFLFCEETNEAFRSNYASPLQELSVGESEPEPAAPQEPVVTPGEEESTGTIAPVTPTPQRNKDRAMSTVGKIIAAVVLSLLALGLLTAAVRRQSIIPLILLILLLLLAAVVDLRAGFGFFPGL